MIASEFEEPLKANLQVLQQCESLVELLSDEQYGKQIAAPAAATVGSHVRHILSHYEAFLAGMNQCHVDYDERSRDMVVQTQKGHALIALENVRNKLSSAMNMTNKVALDTPVSVTLSTSIHAASSQTWPSTLARELVFLHGHSTHHHALMALHMRAMGLELDRDVGMAPSTLAFEASVDRAG